MYLTPLGGFSVDREQPIQIIVARNQPEPESQILGKNIGDKSCL